MLQEVAKPKAQQDPYSSEPVNIEDVVERAVGKFYENKILKPQQEAQHRFTQELEEVQTDDHFQVSGDNSRNISRFPRFSTQFNTGQTSLAKEYRRFKDRYFTNLLSKVTENYRSLIDSGAKGKGNVTPPHMESSGSTNYVPPENKPDTRGQLKDLSTKSRGTDDDLDKMIRTMLPDGDPVLRRR